MRWLAVSLQLHAFANGRGWERRDMYRRVLEHSAGVWVRGEKNSYIYLRTNKIENTDERQLGLSKFDTPWNPKLDL